MPQDGSEEHFHNYVTANRFYVEMERSITASFTECSGLSIKVKKETLFEGGVNDQQRILLGQTEYTDVTLKRGLTDDLVFWDWLLTNVSPSGKKQRRTINILTFNQAGETMQCWRLIGAVPIGWKAPSLQATANTAAIEELTLAYEGLTVINKAKGGLGGGAIELSGGRTQGSFASN
jgi:phage tail-like protein